ncbi:hypothetical protein BV898_13371 [Hypsibius exemplaris]|uniref:Receptor ligand binding region domain-containing protein n=1 Tax=Hypsibius exemplaris TaxID=2072580 RepID=A0A1W0WB12_HYPEX|nr:hypothetical protein BV898_13371 [Hypsibius exemplaris]
MAFVKSEYTLQPAPVMIATSFVVPHVIAVAVMDLLLRYRWLTVFVVVDANSTPMYTVIADEMEQDPRMTVLTWYRRNVRANSLNSFGPLLEEFQNLSRVLVYFGKADQQRRLMVDARARNMTNGEYVYIVDEPYQFPKSYGTVTWSYKGDPDNEAARDAFRSVLVVHPYPEIPLAVSSDVMTLAGRFRAIATTLYNVTVTAYEQPFRDAITSYVSILFLAQVLNETLIRDGPAKLQDGAWLSQQFLNRAFPPPVKGLADTYIDSTGLRRTILGVSHFLAGNGSVRESFLMQSPDAGYTFRQTRDLALEWPGGNWPPPNEPFCGYTNSKGGCQTSLGMYRQR